jgi:predicted transcriptional regulator
MARQSSSRVRSVSTRQEWDVYVVRSTPAKKWLGTVEAADVEAAVAEAVWRFDVKDSSKLIAVRRRP